MELANVLTIAHKQLRDALRNRPFLLFALAFAVLALALSLLAGPAARELSGYTRAAAGLINLALLFVPLIGLTLGAADLAGERESGALEVLLAQPVTRGEVLLGKWLGLSMALLAALALGFGLAALALAGQGQARDAGGYLLTATGAILLGMAMLSVGFLISVLARRTAAALGAALFVWLGLVFISDLGLMGAALITDISIQALFWLAALNPLQLFKMAAILAISADLEVLGPAGMYATAQLGAALLPLLFAGLVLWIALPLLLALRIFSFNGKLRLRKTNT